MKLFQRLLVAPAALGLLTPVAVNATEVNIDEISNYSDLESFEYVTSFDKELNENQLLAGGEGLVESHSHDGGFSETTAASFSADFAIGAVDGNAIEAVTTGYSFQIDLTTSFTGEDSFDVSIDAGNADDGSLDELDLNDSGDGLTVDGVSYTFPLGEKMTAFVGDNMDGSTLYSTACVYGGVTDTLDDCGNASSAMAGGAGTAAGASYEIGNGFTAAFGYTGNGATGLMTDQGLDVYGGQLTYTADSYGASVTYSNEEGAAGDSTFWALNGYWTPAETGTAVPSVSVGYEMGDPDTAGVADTDQWFVGLQWDEAGPGVFGAAIGSNGPISDDDDELTMFEAFYSYPINDSMTITPLIYIEEQAGDDETGFMVKTDFSF